MIPQLIHISTQPPLHGIFKPDKIQPGQMLILVVDGIPYSGQRQINGKPLKLLRKGRDLQLQIQGLIAFSADNFFTDAASSSRPDDGGNLVVPTDHSTDSTAVDIQTLLQEGSAVQIAAVDRGLLSDASNSVLGQPWQSRLVAQAPDTASTTTSKSGATLELAVPSMLDSNHDREGYLVLLMAGLSVALVAGRGGASQSLETFPVWLEPHDETSVPDWIPDFGIVVVSSVTFAENGTGAVYTAAATPDVTGVSMSYSISGGTDSAKFSINSSSGVVGFKTSPDFETPTDAGGDNVYNLVISATEVGNTFIATRSVAVTVQDVNELAPSFASGNSASFAENGTGVAYTALATPRVSGSMSYSISGGTDSAKFSINSSSGVVGFVSSPDFETPNDAGGDNVYNLVISATEVGNTFIATRSVAVTVQDVNELAPSFASGNSASFAENGTGVAYTALATPRVSGSMSYSISGGTDSAKFSINSSSGVVGFVSSPDFETPNDAGGDNVYNLVISATESGNTRSATQSVAVTVTDVGDVAPAFSSASSTTFAENDTGAVYTAVATPDVTGAGISYSISGGTDSAKFSINSSSGVVGFVSSPDFETPTDAGGDNVYNLVISATESGNTRSATRSVAVTVSDVGDVAPAFSSGSSATFAENGTGAVYTAVATPDVTGAGISYSISGGTDSAKFSINSNSGVVGFVSSPDFETATDAGGDNIYNLVISATEVGNTFIATRSVAVTVTDVGDVAPVFGGVSSATFAENGTGAVYTAVATPDVTGAGISYSISGGTDSAKFSINSSSGVVGFVSSLDFETPTDAGGDNVYDLVIQATEIGNTRSATRSVAVTVTDVGDAAPGFTSGSSATFAENGTGAVYTAAATPDVTGVSMSYSISGGTDSAKFSINSSSGVVGFVSSPDFETPTDAGGDNVYDLVIQATEIGNTRSATRSVAVTVTDVGDVAPAFSSASSTTFAENGTGAVYTAVATPDVTGVSMSYSISGGADSAQFSINSSSGVVGFKSSPDFETPTDAGSDNVYNLVISATEVGNTFIATRSVAVTVTDVGDVAPAFSSASSTTFAENGTGAVYTAAATPDVTGVSMSYSISGGADSAQFSINSSSGVVGFKSSPDFETPTDAGSDNVYNLVISATEVGNTFIATRSVAVTVSDVGDVAPAFTSASSATFAENGTGAVYTAVATPDVTGASISYSISGGTDSAKFSINSNSGVVGFVSSPDFETPTDAGGDNVYNLVISATESGNTRSATQSVAVTVTDVGDVAPVFGGVSSATFAENGTGAVYTAVATPDVTGAGISYSISGGTDSAKFSINSSSGVVGFVSSPDFETPTDAGGDNVYDLVIQATEIGNTRSATRSVAVTVTDVGDAAPGFTSGSSATIAENGTGAVYTAAVTPDVTGASISYSISGGTDSAKFSINSSSGVVGFVSSPDFETPTDAGGDNVYDLIVSATEVGNTFIATRSVAVTVSDVGDVAPAFSSASSATFAENGTGAVYTAAATPDVTGASISYSISGGTDSAKFSINSSSGVVGFVSSPDFETPTDAGGDNVYNLVISATEVGNTFIATRSVAVTVSDVGDVAPNFTSGSSTTFTENGTGAVYTAVATPDVTGASISYSISGGADSAQFSINSSSGVVGFKTSPDFETPTDAGGDNVYNLVISATESGNTRSATQSVAVTVSDVGDVAPAFTSASSATFAENGTGAVYTAVATPDVTGASISYSISGGTDSAKFSINSNSGVVGFVSSPDFESPTDAGGDNVYDLIVSATEVGNTFIATRSVAVTVTDVGDVAPAFSSGSSTTFTENGTGAVYTAVATPDVTGASISYSISGGLDAAQFSINSSSGVMGFKSSPDFETPTDTGGDNVYNLVISATESGNTRSATRSVTVTVTDVGDVAPAFSSASSTTFAENDTGAVYTAAATPDVTGASMTYSISGGADSAKFSINSSSGVVGFVSSPDFETPTDAGGDNVYDLIISATESGNTRSATQSVAVTVSDVGDVAPAFSSGSSATFAENGTGAVYTAAATPDVTGASISYSISGGTDSAKFSINSSSGVVGFKSSPDFETPTDTGGDNVYNLVISATEVGNTFIATRSVTVTVTDVGDVAPLLSSGSSATFAENGTGPVYTAVATPDVTGASISYSISGGADSAQFSINSSSGVVGFVSSPDFETPTDAGGDNVYDLIVSATEVGNTFIATRSVAVTVTDVGDVAPAFSSGSSTTFTENGTGAVYTAVATPDVTGASISYSISGGTDSAKFSINSSSGVVGFKSSPDFETPNDAGGDNVYDLIVSATEVGNTFIATRSVAVTVSDVGDVAPAFSSASSTTFAENGTGVVYTAAATPDVTGASISYSISGGADSAQFSINSSSGVVGFVSSPDFETPTDAGGDNVYDLIISATEVGNTFIATRSVAVTVQDVNELAPSFASGNSASFAENGTGVAYTALATPRVSGSMSYSISGGADSAQFSINSSSGVVGFVSSPDFETPTDAGGDNVYDLIISATESGNTRSATQSVAVTVTDVGDVAPLLSSGSSATFAENGTGPVYTAVATPDVTGASMTYSISGGTDSAKFSINSSSGVVGFKSSPDFETPTDAGGDNVYDLIVSATEVGNTFIATRSVAVTVSDVGDVAPAFSSGSSTTFTENGTGAVYTAAAMPDVTGAGISYSISGGTDSAKFSINSSSGVVGFVSSPDFETPTDAGGDNVYDLIVSATEVGNTFIATRSVAVTVQDVNELAPSFASGNSASFAENGTGVAYTALATPRVSGSMSYSISGGADSAQFSINSSSGVVGFKSSPDFETPTDTGGDNVYNLVISATEVGNTFIATRSVAVTVTDVGDVAPAFSSGSSTTFTENGTGVVYTAAATPDVTGAGISYSISGGTDSAKFSINSSSGVVGFKSSPDFETPNDAGGDNVYDLIVSATEVGNTFIATRSVAVTVTDVGDVAPAFSSGSSTTFTENGTGAVYTAVATPDVTGAGISYSISGGTDSAKFSINSNSGVVGFVSSPDFENPTDAGGDNVYDLIVSATEVGNTFIATRSVAVTVSDVGDVAPAFSSASSATFAENGTGVVYTAAATPDVTGASISYSISGGADSAQFSINSSSGVVGFVSSPDFETPTDAGGDNVYDLIISATEVGNTFIATRSVAVTVQDVNELAPSFASGNSASFAENGTGVAYTALATPRVSGSMSYSISGGADSAQFSINSSSGVVGFVSSPDFETPTDAGGDNVYDLIISATEVGNTFIATRSVAVTVQDVNELAPSFASGNSASFAENGTGVAYTALATPRVSGSMSYSISGGADSAQFSINSSSGVVGFVSSPDFETPTDAGGDNVYDLIISATESGNTRSATRSVTVTVINVAEAAPGFTSGSSTTFTENGTGAVYTAVVTPDVTGAGISYSISGGADSAKFSINSSSGVVGFKSSPDFETPTDAGGDNVYNLVISATESGNTHSATRSVTVTVINVAEAAPGFTSGSSTTFTENGTGAVYTAVVTPDVTGAGISYSISGGADSAKFSINSSSGVVGFKSSPDFETPTDAGGDNVYNLVIRATEIGNTRSATRSVAVTVQDVADVAPNFTSASSATFAENGTGAVYTAVATPDVTGVGISYSINGGADSAKFSINSSSGVVSFKSGPDYEAPTDAGSNNIYDIIIHAIEANNTHVATRSVAVTVQNIDDTAPKVLLDRNRDTLPQVMALGTGGEYVVAWQGQDNESAHDTSIYVQKFAANSALSGTRVQLEGNTGANPQTSKDDTAPQLAYIGSGRYAVVWHGFNADAIPTNAVFAQLLGTNLPIGSNRFSAITIGSISDAEIRQPQVVSPSSDTYVVVDTGPGAFGSGQGVKVYMIKNGIIIGSSIELRDGNYYAGHNDMPQVTVVGTSGEFVVVWRGHENSVEHDYSIFVQRFDTNKAKIGSAVKLEAISKTDGNDQSPQITAVGTSGEYVVVWSGQDDSSPIADYSIFVQKFNANGTTSGSSTQLEAIGKTDGKDAAPQVTAVGTSGEYVVVWAGEDDSGGDTSIFVQKFNASGATSGNTIQLEAIGKTDGDDETPRVTAVGTSGEFVVVWAGEDSLGGDVSIFVQKFDANGSISGSAMQLEPNGKTDGKDQTPQVTAVGTSGEFVVVWTGEDVAGSRSVFVQKIASDGNLTGSNVLSTNRDINLNIVLHVQSDETGKAYLVKNDIDLSAGIAALTQANESQWNEVAIAISNTNTVLNTNGLVSGIYDLYAVDAAGNWSIPILSAVTVI